MISKYERFTKVEEVDVIPRETAGPTNEYISKDEIGPKHREGSRLATSSQMTDLVRTKYGLGRRLSSSFTR